MRVLVADIGGTNSRFALYETERLARDGVMPPEDCLGRLRLPTGESSSFADLLRRAAANEPDLFAPREGGAPALAVFAVAGPVRGGRMCNPPNIKWAVNLDDLRGTAGMTRNLPPLPHLLLVNDFVAQAFACLRPGALDVMDIRTGIAVADAPVAVIGAGTGLGKCLLLPPPRAASSSSPPVVLPSEGGHALFPFEGKDEAAFAAFVRDRTGRRVIGDLVVSGPGLRLLHAFHCGEWLEPPEVAARLTPDGEVMRWFARFYGRACRNYVLETLALGGLFIAGGVAASTPGLVTHPAFAEALTESDAHAELLRGLPVRLVRSPHAGLLGAALYGALHAPSFPLPPGAPGGDIR